MEKTNDGGQSDGRTLLYRFISAVWVLCMAVSIVGNIVLKHYQVAIWQIMFVVAYSMYRKEAREHIGTLKSHMDFLVKLTDRIQIVENKSDEK